MRRIRVGELVLDFTLFPRATVDGQHVKYMAESYRAGHKYDPIMTDKKTHRVVDGFHRTKMYLSEEGPDFEVEVVEKTYHSDAELFAHAMRLNATHGRNLSQHDRTHCILVAQKLGVPDDEIASALCMTVEALGKLRVDRIGHLKVAGSLQDVPLKRATRHFANRRLTKDQYEASSKLAGNDQRFMVQQVIVLIEHDLLDKEDETLMEMLGRLATLLATIPLESAVV